MAGYGAPQTYGIGNDTVAWNPLGGPPPMTRFSMNQEVLVNSASQGGWVPATVIEVYPDGTVTVEYVGSGFTKKIPIEHQDTQLKAAGGPNQMPMQGNATVAAPPTNFAPESGMSREYGGAANGPPVGNYGVPPMGGPPGAMGGPPGYGGAPDGAYGGPPGAMGGPPGYGGAPDGAYGGPGYGGPQGGPPGYGGPQPTYGGPQGGPGYGGAPPASMSAPSGFPGAAGPWSNGQGPMGPGPMGPGTMGPGPMAPGPGPMGPGCPPMSASGPGYNYDCSPPPMQQPQAAQPMPAVASGPAPVVQAPVVMQPAKVISGGISSANTASAQAPSTLPIVQSYTAPSASPAYASPISAPTTIAAQPIGTYPQQASTFPASTSPTWPTEEVGRTPLKTAAELGGAPNAIVMRAPKAAKTYNMGQEVMILSDSSGGWVSGVVVEVDGEGTVTVQYGQNRKAIPKEHQGTHLSYKNGATPMGSSSGSGAGMGGGMGMAPPASVAMAPGAAMPNGAMPYAAAPMQDQGGTVRYDLAQIAAMNDQAEQQGFSPFPPQGAPPSYNPAPYPQAAW